MMTDSAGFQPEMHQFEYRWQPARDLSVIAGSLPAEAIQPWADRIVLWVRHPAAGDPAEAPTESVRYQEFGDGTAALAWRQRDPRAAFADGTAQRPEVSRLLIGPAGLLTPEVAMAVCHTGLPEAIGPRPGTVAVGGQLPPVDATELSDLATQRAGELDELAQHEPGLWRVVSAALRNRDTPLSVMIERGVIITTPEDGPQAPLLWGLRRILWPLLGQEAGQRGWSFSTYEPPPGDMDPGALPDIVFRADHVTTGAMTMRREVLVRPHEDAEPPATLYHDRARLLVQSYRDLGGAGLGRHLTALAGHYTSVDQRIQALPGRLAAASVRGARPRPEPVTDRAGPPSYTVAALLDQLYAGPADPGFELARRFLLGSPSSRPEERAAARRQMPSRGWYLPGRGDPGDDLLEAIFSLTVIPDLGTPELTEDLARWAHDAPPRVIRALAGAARNWDAGARVAMAQELMAQALMPALGRRWLAEHAGDAVISSGRGPLSWRPLGRTRGTGD